MIRALSDEGNGSKLDLERKELAAHTRPTCSTVVLRKVRGSFLG
jgi:hypothetical protein